jgi:hypothetical protein
MQTPYGKRKCKQQVIERMFLCAIFCMIPLHLPTQWYMTIQSAQAPPYPPTPHAIGHIDTWNFNSDFCMEILLSILVETLVTIF